MELYEKYYWKNRLRNKINRNANWITVLFGKQDVFNRRQYSGKKFLSIRDTNDRITEYINKGEPFMIARYGGSELKLIRAYFERNLMGKEQEYDEAVEQLNKLSGFFPSDRLLADRFVELMLESSSQIDLLGIWHNFMEDFVCEQYAINSEFTLLRNLEPYYLEGQGWSEALAGKKVLVIHPFEESIRVQYNKRREVWGDRNILPDFELHTIKAVQTLSDQTDDRFETWFDALDYMTKQCYEVDFDVALIGCGAYGLPLAAKIKKMGKGAIHLGGALQILFGIKGSRWDAHPIISSFYNDAWIRSIDEKPKGSEKVEEDCYW